MRSYPASRDMAILLRLLAHDSVAALAAVRRLIAVLSPSYGP
jgi:hypothetical protein